ncbi:hypothetical protein Vadar_031676 [Vaccinium darrowii]|uniref:Uncharacterized protein n=1 Tax=Vaccinium darrowii TaxID=229202 RepID=A0ACB7YIM0_9ERIC|nr:hypothetical protein Vadar_031676 [Vaccinium darrowii]
MVAQLQPVSTVVAHHGRIQLWPLDFSGSCTVIPAQRVIKEKHVVNGRMVANPRIITACLEELENILKVGEVEKNLDNSTDVNYNAHLIHKADGFEKT